MNLLIDVGNTSIHWRLYESGAKGSPTVSLRHKHQWPETLATLTKTLGAIALTNIYVASVAGQKAREQITDWCVVQFTRMPTFVHSEKQKGLISNAYTKPEQLGVDRWLAVQAGHAKLEDDAYAAALIVDAGTAMTMDAVLMSGEHLGGSIVAGLHLQQQSLLDNTSEIATSDGDQTIWARNTASAVASGAYLALVGAIVAAYQQLQHNFKSEAEVLLLLTGGDAETLEQYFSGLSNVAYEVHTNLVLDGLETYVG